VGDTILSFAKKKVNLPIVGGIGIGVVLIIIAVILVASGTFDDCPEGEDCPIPIWVDVLIHDAVSLGAFSLEGASMNRGEIKGSITIQMLDTPLEGKIYIECDKSGRDYWTAWRYMYNSPQEALSVAGRLGLEGYHQHGELFMPGKNHFSYVQDEEIAFRIPPQSTGKYLFYENDADILTCFYQRNAEWNAGAVKWNLDGVVIGPESQACVHKSSTFQNIALGAETHCVVIEIQTKGDHTLTVVDLVEFAPTAKIVK